jgi:hypothetical protein
MIEHSNERALYSQPLLTSVWKQAVFALAWFRDRPAGHPPPGRRLRDLPGHRLPVKGRGRRGCSRRRPRLWREALDRSPSRLRFQALRRFHSLRPDFERLGSPFARPKADEQRRRRLRVMLRTASSLPQKASDAGLRPGRFPAKPPACYRASW